MRYEQKVTKSPFGMIFYSVFGSSMEDNLCAIRDYLHMEMGGPMNRKTLHIALKGPPGARPNPRNQFPGKRRAIRGTVTTKLLFLTL